jgi:plasmid stabilization system protein ParE
MPDRFRIILSKRFANDLQKIFDEIARDSQNNAADFIGRILKSIESLKQFPH